MSDKPRRGLLSEQPLPNVPLALLELTKAVIRMEAVVRALVDKTYPPVGGLAPGMMGAFTDRDRHLVELDQVRSDILNALNAATGEKNGG